ncbi:hypothetical protein BJY01DRAFT_169286 [Aspergillus pseudoustus]|uniref:rRNA adenine N(6)-methyltransferase n=1 Tax=Aspergillus pseudoustus TaxID=1810923 RepID=A0ABR4K3T1_9EURO
MPQHTRWTAVSRFPVTKALSKTLSRAGTVGKKPVIVSEKLCDDVLQRLSPYLLRNPPVDILDLWPGPGILSSKVNDFLKPRRHVLMEPNLKYFKSFLEPLTQSRSCYELVSIDLKPEQDWQSLLSKHFPEQGPSNTDNSGFLPRNDSLLVLASPPPPSSRKDHFSGARWFLTFLETCLRQAHIHSYGSVRLLASISPTDTRNILPTLIHERERPAMLTEQLARHAFAVATTDDPTRSDWIVQRQYDILADGAARVAQRASEAGISNPAERKLPPLELAPESPIAGTKPTPYSPRIRTGQNEKYIAAFEAFDKADPKSPDYEKVKQLRSRAATSLNQENRQSHVRKLIVGEQARIDELNKAISRLAADPKIKLADLEPVVKEIEARITALAEETAQHHFDLTRAIPYLIDDRRATLDTGSFDDATLLWDRRPFEPLLIHEEEAYPREIGRTLFYFEADQNAHAAKRLSRLTQQQKYMAFEVLDAYTLSLSLSRVPNVVKLTESLFPGLSTNQVIEAIPSLAQFASKRPKPDFDSLPKTLHYDASFKPPSSPSASATKNEKTESDPDPVYCYQENLDYDLSQTRCRILPISTLWDMFAKYAERSTGHSVVQLTRMLGGNVTMARSGVYSSDNRPGKRF